MSKEAIDKGHEQLLAAIKSRDAGAVMAILTDDVAFYPPGERTRKGQPDVKEWVQRVLADLEMEQISIADREVVVSGDLGFEAGNFRWTGEDVRSGQAARDRGRFVTIWQRQYDGSWKAARNIWHRTEDL